MSALVAKYRETRHYQGLAPETLRKARKYLANEAAEPETADV